MGLAPWDALSEFAGACGFNDKSVLRHARVPQEEIIRKSKKQINVKKGCVAKLKTCVREAKKGKTILRSKTNKRLGWKVLWGLSI